jgi:hypothetical protein
LRMVMFVPPDSMVQAWTNHTPITALWNDTQSG